MKTVKLSKAESILYDKDRKEIMDIVNLVGALGGEVINFRLRDMALEKGIDLANENWQFNADTKTFSLVEPVDKKVVPSGKADAKKGKKKKSG